MEDLEGFRSLGAFKSPAENNYGIFGRGKFLALVHLDDEEVVFILNRKKRVLVYQCPNDLMFGPLLESMVDEMIDQYMQLMKKMR